MEAMGEYAGAEAGRAGTIAFPGSVKRQMALGILFSWVASIRPAHGRIPARLQLERRWQARLGGRRPSSALRPHWWCLRRPCGFCWSRAHSRWTLPPFNSLSTGGTELYSASLSARNVFGRAKPAGSVLP